MQWAVFVIVHLLIVHYGGAGIESCLMCKLYLVVDMLMESAKYRLQQKHYTRIPCVHVQLKVISFHRSVLHISPIFEKGLINIRIYAYES